MEKKSFKIREDYFAVIGMLTNEQAGKLLKGLCVYVFEDEPFESTDRKVQGAFEVIKKHLDNEIRGREFGRIYGHKGWIRAMENRQKVSNEKIPNHNEDTEREVSK